MKIFLADQRKCSVTDGEFVSKVDRLPCYPIGIAPSRS
jgi:hypothetical protein